MIIGILSLQGDFAEHIEALKANGFETRAVKNVKDFEGLSGLVIPGGESTAIDKLMKLYGIDEAIRSSYNNGLKIWGTCAGAILLAKKIISKKPIQGLVLADIEVERNAYGNQLESFETVLKLDEINVNASFIRAPVIRNVGAGFESLIVYNGNPVLVKGDRVLISTFHTELSSNRDFYTWLAKFFKNE